MTLKIDRESDMPVSAGTVSAGTDQELESLAKQKQPNLAWEFFDFLRTNKKWWLSPILLAIAVISLFAILSLSPAAPFIYTLF